MADINHVVLVGRLTRDAELKMTNSGLAILHFSLAVNRSVKQGDKWEKVADFFDVTTFGKQGEALAKYMTKGTQIGIEGGLRQDRWEHEGKKMSKVAIVADNIQLLGSKDAPRQDNQASAAKAVFEDDIPF